MQIVMKAVVVTVDRLQILNTGVRDLLNDYRFARRSTFREISFVLRLYSVWRALLIFLCKIRARVNALGCLRGNVMIHLFDLRVEILMNEAIELQLNCGPTAIVNG